MRHRPTLEQIVKAWEGNMLPAIERAIKRGHSVSIEVARGFDDDTPPDGMITQLKPSDRTTFTIKINGGA